MQPSLVARTGISALAANTIAGGYTTAITATGSTQSDAFALTNANNFIGTAAAGTGVILPLSEPMATYFVYNGGANAVKVYPPVGGTISNLATNSPLVLQTGGAAWVDFSTATACGVVTSNIGSTLPAEQYATTTAGTSTMAAGAIEGAQECFYAASGQAVIALTTRTAAQLFAGVPNAYAGATYFLRIINNNSGTLTITGGSGVAITGTATLATNTTRDFIVTLTSSSAVALQSVGTGTDS